MNNRARYMKCFTEMFEISDNEAKTLAYQEITAWDSVGHMNLISVIEEEFDIEMDIDDITDLSSFDKGLKTLEKYGIDFNA